LWVIRGFISGLK